MAIAFDVGSWSSAGDLASGSNHSHAGGASARAACVLIAHGASASDLVTAVTYGGVAMNRVRSDSEATEAGRVYIYWLDNIAGGTQNVVLTHTATTVRIAVFTMTVAAGQRVAVDGQGTGTSASVANPSWTMATTASTNTICGEVIHSGLQTMTNTPASGWSLVVAGALETGSAHDAGNVGNGFARGPFTGGTVTCGWTAATADDFVGASVAFKEEPIPLAPPIRERHVQHKSGLTTRPRRRRVMV